MRAKHYKVGLLPKISPEELRLSLSLRHGPKFFKAVGSATADAAATALGGGGSAKKGAKGKGAEEEEEEEEDDDGDARGKKLKKVRVV